MALANGNLLISDIDDTIKQTHIHKKVLGIPLGGRHTHNPFHGMKGLYDKFVENKHKNNSIIYLTASPGILSKFGKNFIKNTHFPNGNIIHRKILEKQDTFKSDHIVNEILNHSSGHPDAQFILVGDNGERDIQAFNQAISQLQAKKFATKRIYPFVHHVYAESSESKMTEDSIQTYFVTAGDLALQWYSLGFISELDLNLVVGSVSAALTSKDVKTRETVIPSWMECKGFIGSKLYKQSTVVMKARTQKKITQLEGLINKVCESIPN
jgi:hypothetical protein